MTDRDPAEPRARDLDTEHRIWVKMFGEEAADELRQQAEAYKAENSSGPGVVVNREELDS